MAFDTLLLTKFVFVNVSDVKAHLGRLLYSKGNLQSVIFSSNRRVC